MKIDLKLFVASELSELETRDPDQLYACIADNLEEMGVKFEPETLYELIEEELRGAK